MALLNIKIQLDGTQFRDESGRIVGAVDGMQGKVSASLDSLTAKVGLFALGFNQVIGVAQQLAGALTAPLAKFAEFETSLANVGSLGVNNMGEIRAEVLEMARAVSVPISALTAGMYEVVSAGVAASDQINFLGLTAKAAKAGVAENNETIKFASAVIKGYGLEWSATQSILDRGFQTVNLGQTTFTELAQSMGGVVPLANALNVRLDELFGSYAALTGVTGNTSEVTTQLKAVMTGLADPTEDLLKLVQAHGHATVESAVAQEGLTGILKILQTATGGSATEMAKFFGSVEAVNALLALTGEQFNSFTEKTEAMANSAGAMTAAYEVQSDTIESRWLIMQNRANVRLFEFLDTVKPAIIGLQDFAITLIDLDWRPFIIGATTAGAALIALNFPSVIAGLTSLGTAIISFSATATAAITAIPLVGWVAAGVTALATLTSALILTAKDEADLADERKRTAQETINIIKAEQDRIQQAVATDGATVETTNKLRLLNEELIRQQKIISDANLTIFTQKLQEAQEDLADLQQGLIDRFDLTGILLRDLQQRAGNDLIKMEEVATKRLAELGDFQFKNKLGLIQLTEQELETIQAEHASYSEIIQPLQQAAQAQKNYNQEIANRERLLQSKSGDDLIQPNIPGPTKVVQVKAVVGKTNQEEVEKELKALIPVGDNVIELPLRATFSTPAPSFISELKSFTLDMQSELSEETFNKEDELLRLQVDNKLLTEEDYFNQRVMLLEDFQQRQQEIFGAESAEALRVSLEKTRFEEQYFSKKRQLEEQSLRSFLGITSGLMGAFQGINENLFAVGKGFAYAQAVVDTYAAANKALAAYPPPFSYIAAAASIATGLANVAKINTTKFERRDEGGFLGDESRTLFAGDFGGGENRFIIANDGEFIINRAATARHRELLELINASDGREIFPRRQEGGAIGGGPTSSPAAGLGNIDVVELGRQIGENIQIELRAELDAMRFYRQTLPKYEREENLRRLA